MVLLTLPGVTDMDAALALKGKEVTIRREDVELPEGYFFDVEIEGMRVVDCATEEEIGKVKRVLTYPAHKIYVVHGDGKEYLIPAVKDVFIMEIDMEENKMIVRMMKGLETDAH